MLTAEYNIEVLKCTSRQTICPYLKFTSSCFVYVFFLDRVRWSRRPQTVTDHAMALVRNDWPDFEVWNPPNVRLMYDAYKQMSKGQRPPLPASRCLSIPLMWWILFWRQTNSRFMSGTVVASEPNVVLKVVKVSWKVDGNKMEQRK